MELIPAIDIRGGRTVRLRFGDYAQETIYEVEPAEIATQFVDAGAAIIHVVDLDGARDGRPVNGEQVRLLTQLPGARIELGGGIRTMADIEAALSWGVTRVVLGSVLLKDPDLAKMAFREYGDRVVAGIDARDGMVATEGWLDDSHVSASELVREMTEAGCARFIVTDIATDGALLGPNPGFIAAMIAATDRPVIASGGIGREADFDPLLELNPAPEGVIVGRAIYEQKIDLKASIGRLRSHLG
jgi:phosphoribosylformimino-5-aminoimidazole carboxamide ribotide isomerase